MTTRLVAKDGHLIKAGDKVLDFRGDEVTVIDWSAPQHAASSGRVVLRDKSGWEHPYFPGVINADIVEDNDEPGIEEFGYRGK